MFDGLLQRCVIPGDVCRGVLFLASSTVEQRQDKRADALNLLPSLDVKASSITGYHLDNPGLFSVWMRLKRCWLEGGKNLPPSFKEIHR